VASEAEVAVELGLSLEAYHHLLREAHGAQILYAEDLIERSADHDSNLSGQPTGGNPLDGVLLQDLRQVLMQAIERLPERERLLLSLIYQDELNIKEVALVLEVSEGRVCQLRTQAVGRIRAYLQARAWTQRPSSLTDVVVF
jgi:RNA polymerase sigma factor for flagellar operon FliA